MTAILDNGEWKVPIKIDSSTIVYRKADPHEIPHEYAAEDVQDDAESDSGAINVEAPKRRGRPPKAKE